MNYNFCCFCFPLRFGTIILSIISLFISTFFAIAFLGKPIVTSQVVFYGLSHGLTIIIGIIYIIMALISIFGIIGAIFVTSKRIKLLESILRGAVTANIIIAFLVITNMIRAKQEAIDLCIQKDPSFLMDEGQRQIQNATESFENSVVNKLSNATSNDNTNESLSNYCRHHEIVRIWLRSIGLILSALFVAYFSRVTKRYSNELNFPPKLVERNVAGDSTDKLDTPSMT